MLNPELKPLLTQLNTFQFRTDSIYFPNFESSSIPVYSTFSWFIFSLFYFESLRNLAKFTVIYLKIHKCQVKTTCIHFLYNRWYVV